MGGNQTFAANQNPFQTETLIADFQSVGCYRSSGHNTGFTLTAGRCVGDRLYLQFSVVRLGRFKHTCLVDQHHSIILEAVREWALNFGFNISLAYAVKPSWTYNQHCRRTLQVC